MTSKIMLLICITFMLNACKKDEYWVFYLKNNSQKSITYSYSLAYPDTSITWVEAPGFINPGDSGAVWTIIKAPPTNTQQVIQLFLFDKKVFGIVPWDSIVKKNMVLKHYTLTVDTIGKLKSTVTYTE